VRPEPAILPTLQSRRKPANALRSFSTTAASRPRYALSRKSRAGQFVDHLPCGARVWRIVDRSRRGRFRRAGQGKSVPPRQGRGPDFGSDVARPDGDWSGGRARGASASVCELRRWILPSRETRPGIWPKGSHELRVAGSAGTRFSMPGSVLKRIFQQLGAVRIRGRRVRKPFRAPRPCVGKKKHKILVSARPSGRQAAAVPSQPGVTGKFRVVEIDGPVLKNGPIRKPLSPGAQSAFLALPLHRPLVDGFGRFLIYCGLPSLFQKVGFAAAAGRAGRGKKKKARQRWRVESGSRE